MHHKCETDLSDCGKLIMGILDARTCTTKKCNQAIKDQMKLHLFTVEQHYR